METGQPGATAQPATSVPVSAPQNLAQPSQGQYSQSQPTPTPGTFSYFPVMPNQQSMGAASGMFPQMQGAQAPRPGYMPLMSAVNLGAQFPHAIPQQYTATSATAASPQAGLPQGPRAVYAYPVLNAPAGPACAPPAGAGAPRPTQYNNPNALAAAAAALATAEGVVVNCGASSPGGVPSGGLSPKAMRKLSHNAVEVSASRHTSARSPLWRRSPCEPTFHPLPAPCVAQVRRRRRISMQLDRLKTMLNRREPSD